MLRCREAERPEGENDAMLCCVKRGSSEVATPARTCESTKRCRDAVLVNVGRTERRFLC